MKVLIDTHIWFYIENDLSKITDNLLAKISSSYLSISSFSIWELAMLEKKNRLRFNQPINEWIESSIKRHDIEIINPNHQILLKSVQLEWDNPDPADRIIISTAIENNIPLITFDKKIINSKLIETIS